MTARTLYKTAFGLGLASLGALGVAFLALTDIFHGEAEVSLEWSAVRAAFIIMMAFHVAGLVGVRRATRETDTRGR